MNAVLDWVKANVFIVVFALVMIAAAVALPMFSGRMNANVRAAVNTRVQNFNQLAQLERSEIVPGHTGVPNEATIRRYEQVAKVVAEDAAEVQRAAIEHNRKGRGVLMPRAFPEPPQVEIEVIPRQFHERLVEAYQQLLREVQGGMPPSLEQLRQTLTMVHTQFVTQDLKKDLSETLSEDEQRQLTEKLTSARLAAYVEAAERIGMYITAEALAVPDFNRANPPSIGELFNWQWQYWVTEDLLRALHQANRNEGSVVQSPVKHVQYISLSGLPTASAAQGSGAVGTRPGAGGGFGGGAMDMGGGGDTAPGVGGTPANPKAPAPRDFKVSLTGRATNPLYDVINVEVGLVVENHRLPQVLDEIAKYNFMTVTGLQLKAVNPFEALAQGFFYGPEPVTEVHLNIETIWLREWTREFMPKATRQALGIPLASPAGTS